MDNKSNFKRFFSLVDDEQSDLVYDGGGGGFAETLY